MISKKECIAMFPTLALINRNVSKEAGFDEKLRFVKYI